MGEESHREEMSAAIRAQRERGAAPGSLLHGSLLPPLEEPQPDPPAPRPRGFVARLLRRRP